MSHGVVCKYHYRENFRVWLTSVTVWLFFREGVAKCPCKCGSVSEIYKFQREHPRLSRKFTDTIERTYSACSWMPDERFQDAISDAVDEFLGAAPKVDIY